MKRANPKKRMLGGKRGPAKARAKAAALADSNSDAEDSDQGSDSGGEEETEEQVRDQFGWKDWMEDPDLGQHELANLDEISREAEMDERHTLFTEYTQSIQAWREMKDQKAKAKAKAKRQAKPKPKAKRAARRTQSKAKDARAAAREKLKQETRRKRMMSESGSDSSSDSGSGSDSGSSDESDYGSGRGRRRGKLKGRGAKGKGKGKGKRDTHEAISSDEEDDGAQAGSEAEEDDVGDTREAELEREQRREARMRREQVVTLHGSSAEEVEERVQREKYAAQGLALDFGAPANVPRAPDGTPLQLLPNMRWEGQRDMDGNVIPRMDMDGSVMMDMHGNVIPARLVAVDNSTGEAVPDDVLVQQQPRKREKPLTAAERRLAQQPTLPELGLMDLRVTRAFMEKHVEEPYFDEAVTGGFVKIPIGKREGKDVYRICEIKRVCSSKEVNGYKLPGPRDPARRVKKSLVIAFGISEREWKISRVSNHKFTDDEYAEWKAKQLIDYGYEDLEPVGADGADAGAQSKPKQVPSINILRPSVVRRRRKEMGAALKKEYSFKQVEKLVADRMSKKKMLSNSTTERLNVQTRIEALQERLAQEEEVIRQAEQAVRDKLSRQEARRATQREERDKFEALLKRGDREASKYEQEKRSEFEEQDSEMPKIILWREELESLLQRMRRVEEIERLRKDRSAKSDEVNRLNKINAVNSKGNTSTEVELAQKKRAAWVAKAARAAQGEVDTEQSVFERNRCAPAELWLMTGANGKLDEEKSKYKRDGDSSPADDKKSSKEEKKDSRPSLSHDVQLERIRKQVAAYAVTPGADDDLGASVLDTLDTPHTPGAGAGSGSGSGPGTSASSTAAVPPAAAPAKRKGLSLADYKKRKASAAS